MQHGSLNVLIEHHPTIRYMVYNGYYKVMSNIPKMGTVTNPCASQAPRQAQEGLKPVESGAKQYDKEGALFWSSKRKRRQTHKNGPSQYRSHSD